MSVTERVKKGEDVREQQRTDDGSMSDMERGCVLTPVNERGADSRTALEQLQEWLAPHSPSKIGNSNRHRDGHSSLNITTSTSTSPCQHDSNTREHTTSSDDGSSIRCSRVASRRRVEYRISSDSDRCTEYNERSTEFHVVGDDTDENGEEAAGDVRWGGEKLSVCGRVTEFVDDLVRCQYEYTIEERELTVGMNREKAYTGMRTPRYTQTCNQHFQSNNAWKTNFLS